MKRPRHSMTWVLGLAVGMMVLPACKKDEPAAKPAANQAAGSPAQKAASGGSSLVPEETPLLTTVEIASMLPADVAAVAVIDGVAPMLERLGYAAARKANGSLFTWVAEHSKTFYGYDLTDPAGFDAIGLDLSAPAGIAVWHGKAPGLAVFCGLSDAAKFKAFVDRTAKNRWKVKEFTAGDSVIFQVGGPTTAFLLRGKTAVLISSPQIAKDVAMEFANRTAETSWSANPVAKKALAGFGYGKQGSAWIDPVEVATFVIAGAGDFGKPDNALRRKARTLVESVLGKSPGIVLGGELQPTGIHLKGLLALDSKSPMRPMLRKPANHTVLAAISESPMFTASAHLDPKALYRAIREAAKLAGAGDEFLDGGKFLKLLGIDVNSLDKTFTGELGFALTGDITKLGDNMSEKALVAAVGGTLVVGLAKDSPLKNALTVASGMIPSEAKGLISGGDGAWTINVPDFKPVYISVVANHLVVSTEKDAANRAAAGGAPGFLASLEPKSGAGYFQSPSALVSGLKLSALTYYFLAEQSDRADIKPPRAGDAAAVAHAVKLAAKQKELDALYAEIRQAEMESIGKFMSPLGLLVGNAAPVAEGFNGSAGLVLQGTTTPKYFSAAMGAVNDLRMADRNVDEINALANEMSNLYRSDTATKAVEAEKGVIVKGSSDPPTAGGKPPVKPTAP